MPLATIFTDTREQLRKLREKYQPQAATILREPDQIITELLTPEQLPLWPSLLRPV